MRKMSGGGDTWPFTALIFPDRRCRLPGQCGEMEGNDL